MTIYMDAKNYEFILQAATCHKHLRDAYDDKGPNWVKKWDAALISYRNLEAMNVDLAMEIIVCYTKYQRGFYSTDFTQCREQFLDKSINGGACDSKAIGVERFFDSLGFKPGQVLPAEQKNYKHPIVPDSSLPYQPISEYELNWAQKADDFLAECPCFKNVEVALPAPPPAPQSHPFFAGNDTFVRAAPSTRGGRALSNPTRLPSQLQ
jgi:hypothetical protein